MRVGLYLRKSTTDRSDEELRSTAIQEANARKFAAKHGWTVVKDHVYKDDGVSGARISRPGFDRLKAALGLVDGQAWRRPPDPAALPFNILVVRDQSRLIRNADHATFQIKRLLRTGLKIAFYKTGEVLDLSNFRSLVVGVTGHVDSEYREAVRLNVREGLAKYAEKGLVCGGCCFGYINRPVMGASASGQPVRLYTDLAIHAEQAKVVRRVVSMFAVGMSFRYIAAKLNELGVPKPKQGQRGSGRWSASTICDMVRNPRYRGILIYGRSAKQEDDYGDTYRVPQTDGEKIIRVERADLRIIPPKLWKAAQRRLRREQ